MPIAALAPACVSTPPAVPLSPLRPSSVMLAMPRLLLLLLPLDRPTMLRFCPLLLDSGTLPSLRLLFRPRQTALSTFLPLLPAIAAGFRAVALALISNPFVLIGIAVIALAFIIYKNWDKIKTFLVKTWDVIKSAASAAWNWIKNVITSAVSAVVGFVKAHWQLLLAILLGPFGIAVGLIITYCLGGEWTTASDEFQLGDLWSLAHDWINLASILGAFVILLLASLEAMITGPRRLTMFLMYALAIIVIGCIGTTAVLLIAEPSWVHTEYHSWTVKWTTAGLWVMGIAGIPTLRNEWPHRHDPRH